MMWREKEDEQKARRRTRVIGKLQPVAEGKLFKRISSWSELAVRRGLFAKSDALAAHKPKQDVAYTEDLLVS